MRILSLNINDFGGSDFFVEKIKKDYEGCWQRKWNEIQSKFDYEKMTKVFLFFNILTESFGLIITLISLQEN